MKKIFSLLAFFLATNSFAGILIEPQLAYAFSHKLNQTITITLGNASGSTNVNSSGTALEYGGRFGYQFLGLMFGGSYHKGANNKGTNMGAFVGYSAPLFLRAWVAYNFDAKVNYTNAGTEGKSTEVGVGYTALPLVSLNFVYRKYDMNKLTSSGVTYGCSGVTPTELLFGISVPFDI